MENLKFEDYIDVYKYLYDVDYTDVSFGAKYGIKIGLLEWSSITGEAQALLKSSFNQKKTGKFKVMWDNFMKEENFFTASKWIYSRPVSVGGSVSVEYLPVLETLLKKSIPLQKKALMKEEGAWKRNCTALGITTNNLRAVVLARMLRKPFTRKELEELSLQSHKDVSIMLDSLSPDAASDSLLEDRVKYIPGKDLSPGRVFDWLFEEEDVNGS